ncbi:MAG: hypothetical protein R3258_07815 [Acidimicrobiia bacterium]|nr:hypothetical protein [Acidimicrobiia bacterium]
MSDEQHMPDMPDEHGMSEPPEPDPTGQVRTGMPSIDDFSTGEGLITLGAMILLGVWLIFDVITDDYGLSILTVVLAAAAVILPRLKSEAVEAYHTLGMTMKALGWALALTGAVEIIADLEAGIFSSDATTIIAGVLGWLGFGVVFQGARTAKG